MSLSWREKQRVTQMYRRMDLGMFLVQVTLGNVPGHKIVNKFGSNFEIDTTMPEDMWTYGGIYVFSDEPLINTLSSSSALDTHEMNVDGYDFEWNEISQLAQLDGQNQVILETPLIRQHRMYNNSNVYAIGDIYCYENSLATLGVPDEPSKVRSMINIGKEQTQMAIFSIPAKKVGILFEAYSSLGMNRAASSSLQFMAAEFGKVMRVKNRVSLGSQGDSSSNRSPKLLAKFKPKTDITIRIPHTSVNDSDFSGGFDILLVDEELSGMYNL